MKRIITITGPSGSGKSSLVKELQSFLGIPEAISTTTRGMRKGEKEGVSYYFVSKDDFDQIEKVEYSGYSAAEYCLSQKELDNKFKENDSVFVVVDANGVDQIKEKYGEAVVSIFIEVTYDEMVKRMELRGDNKENIIKRISNAIITDELKNGSKCNYTVRNEIFSQAVFEIHQILKSEGILPEIQNLN